MMVVWFGLENKEFESRSKEVMQLNILVGRPWTLRKVPQPRGEAAAASGKLQLPGNCKT